MDGARKLLLDQVEGFKATPVTEAELARAKSSLLNGIDKTINDAQRLGVQLSEPISKGDWRLCAAATPCFPNDPSLRCNRSTF